MLNLYLQTQTDIVERHGGDIDKFVADEVVAVFQGAEMENRALACAFEIQDAMEGLRQEHPGWNLHVGIGLNVGDVVVGAMGARSRMDFTILGDAVNLAARLCSVAAPGSILVSQALKDAVGVNDCVLKRLPAMDLKGKRDPVEIFEAHHAD